MMAQQNGLEGLASCGLDAMQSGNRQTSPEAFFGGGATEPQIKQEEGVVPAQSAALVGATHSVMASGTGPRQEPCQVDSKGNVLPVPPPKQGEAGDSLPWSDKGYLPVGGGKKSPPSKQKPRRTKTETSKVAVKVKRAKFTRRGRKNLSKGINKEILDKFRSAEYTRTDQQLRTEARLKRLQEIYAHEVSGAALDEQMKKEKLKLIELENNRRAAKVSRAKKRQYIRDLEQRVEMFSKHIATLEMENSELRAALNKGGVGGGSHGHGHHGHGMQMPSQMQQMQEMPMSNSMEPAAPQMDPNMMAMMGGMNPMMMGMGMPGMMAQQTSSAPQETSSAPQSSITSPSGKQPKMEPNTAPQADAQQQALQQQQQMMAMMMGGMGMMPGMMGGMPGMAMPGMMNMDPNVQQQMMGQMAEPAPIVKAEPMS